jgi:hypothetical protein
LIPIRNDLNTSKPVLVEGQSRLSEALHCPIQVKTRVATSTTAKPIKAIKANRELTRDTNESPNCTNPKENPKDCRLQLDKVAIQHT